jgi:hypothetical protein
MELKGKRARFSGPDLWFRSSVKIGHPVGSLCFLFRLSTLFSLLGSYCSEIVPKPFVPRHLKKSRNVFFPARETRDTSAKSESTCPRSIPKGF